jgi:hypothetical protein
MKSSADKPDAAGEANGLAEDPVDGPGDGSGSESEEEHEEEEAVDPVDPATAEDEAEEDMRVEQALSELEAGSASDSKLSTDAATTNGVASAGVSLLVSSACVGLFVADCMCGSDCRMKAQMELVQSLKLQRLSCRHFPYTC